MSPPINALNARQIDIIRSQTHETAHWADSDEETGDLCESYQRAIDPLVKAAVKNPRIVGILLSLTADDLSDFGHGLWLTARGHGCGFWDGDWIGRLSSENIKFLCDWCGKQGLDCI